MNILSFDIEEWFHILDNSSTKTEKEWKNFESRIHKNMERIFQILEDCQTSATFFCLGWVAQKYPEIIKQIDDLGYEIGTHSDTHQLAYEMNRKEFNEDLKRSINKISDLTGKKVKYYRAPGFSIKKDNLWAFECLVEHGITCDSSIFPASRAHGGIPNFPQVEPCIISYQGVTMKEFPINTMSVFGKRMIFSGGGYFRLFPYHLIRRQSRKADYIMTYFHPRDFDPNQPFIENLGFARKFKSYYGLSGSEEKLRKWLSNFDFFDLSMAIDTIQWEKKKVIYL